MSAFVKFEDVKKIYHMGEVSIEALSHASFEIEKGEMIAFIGPNGAGKTTLMRVLTTVLKPTNGTVTLDGI